MFILATSDITTIIVAVIGTGVLGGIGTGLRSLFKPRAERDQVIVNAAKGSLVMQEGLMEALNAELKRSREDAAADRERMDQMRDQMDEFERKLDDVRRERDAYRDERDAFKRQLTEAEATIARLRAELHAERGDV